MFGVVPFGNQHGFVQASTNVSFFFVDMFCARVVSNEHNKYVSGIATKKTLDSRESCFFVRNPDFEGFIHFFLKKRFGTSPDKTKRDAVFENMTLGLIISKRQDS